MSFSLQEQAFHHVKKLQLLYLPATKKTFSNGTAIFQTRINTQVIINCCDPKVTIQQAVLKKHLDNVLR